MKLGTSFEYAGLDVLLTDRTIYHLHLSESAVIFLMLPPPTKLLLEAQKNKKLDCEMSLTHQQHPNFL